MAVSKVILNGSTLIDTTDKTVTAASMLNGVTALKNDGTTATGNIASKTSSDLTASGATVTVPAGYYASSASKSVASGTTDRVSLTFNASTGHIEATANIAAGYYGAQVWESDYDLSTQAAQTIHPSTSNQYISEHKYLLGDQTIKAVTHNLTAENIKSGVTLKIGDSDDDDRVASVTGSYTGGGITPTGSITITSNTTTDVTNYASAITNVPNTYAAGDEGRVVSNGALVSQTSATYTANNTYDTTLIDSVTVNVSAGGGTSVTESVWMAAAEPTDNNLHLWIDLDPALGLDVRLYLGGTGTIDWGDGNTDSSNTSWPKAHSYAESGVYEVVVSGAFTIPNNNIIIQTNPYLYKSRRLLRRAYVPAKDIGQYKFQPCYALEKVTIKGNGKQGTATTIGMYCFSTCYALREIIIPDGVSTLGACAFENTRTATYVSIPSTCTGIGAQCFNYCGSLEFHIAATTPPNLLNTNAFSNGQSGALIYVPYSEDHSVLAEYENASNWATLYTNGRIVEESP